MFSSHRDLFYTSVVGFLICYRAQDNNANIDAVEEEDDEDGSPPHVDDSFGGSSLNFSMSSVGTSTFDETMGEGGGHDVQVLGISHVGGKKSTGDVSEPGVAAPANEGRSSTRSDSIRAAATKESGNNTNDAAAAATATATTSESTGEVQVMSAAVAPATRRATKTIILDGGTLPLSNVGAALTLDRMSLAEGGDGGEGEGEDDDSNGGFVNMDDDIEGRGDNTGTTAAAAADVNGATSSTPLAGPTTARSKNTNDASAVAAATKKKSASMTNANTPTHHAAAATKKSVDNRAVPSSTDFADDAAAAASAAAVVGGHGGSRGSNNTNDDTELGATRDYSLALNIANRLYDDDKANGLEHTANATRTARPSPAPGGGRVRSTGRRRRGAPSQRSAGIW